MKKISAVFFILFFLACVQRSTEEQSKESSSIPEKDEFSELKQKGAAITKEMQQTLFKYLTQAVSDSGVAYALNYCNVKALSITDSLSKIHYVNLSRVSHHPRNPKNAAGPIEQNIISSYIASLENDEPLQPVIEESEKHSTFYSPIILASPLCLNCHGIPNTDIAPENFIVINMLYPEDKATGFKLNDVRGLWKIQFPKTEAAL